MGGTVTNKQTKTHLLEDISSLIIVHNSEEELVGKRR